MPGAAKWALKVRLGAIEGRQGGLVETYPVARWGAYRKYLGAVSMFRRAGFRVVDRFGSNNVVVRRTV
jgi:hypothetical protein